MVNPVPVTFLSGLILGILALGCADTSQHVGRMGPFLKPNEEFYLSRAYPDVFVDPVLYQERLQHARESEYLRSGAARFDKPWTLQGPGNIGARVNTIAVHPLDDRIMLAGFSAGGIFRTEDGGLTWHPVFDDKPGLSIGDIAFDPGNPDIVFAGTGDPNIGGYPFVGNGIYKSVDGGISWEYAGLGQAGIVAKVEVHPTDSRKVVCAVMGYPFFRSPTRGLYQSEDGGESWEQILYLSDSTGVIDFLVHPQDPGRILAAGWDRIRNNKESIIGGNGARIYKTVNGGASWQMLDNGLPLEEFSRIGLAGSQQNPDMVIAAYIGRSNEMPCLHDELQLAGIYRSEDFGETWSVVPTSEANGLNCNALGDFGWYFAKVRIHPANNNEIYLLGVDLWRTIDNGENWSMVTPPWWHYAVHADKHDLVFHGDSLILATDGGLYKAGHADEMEWRDIENIAATQFYRVAYNPHKPEYYYGGAQDNGTTGGNRDSINAWPRIFGADGFQPLFHPVDSNIFYVETQRGGTYVTVNGGKNFKGFSHGLDPGSTKFWDMPFVMSAHNPDLLYAGGKALYRATEGPDSYWEQVSPDLTKGDTLLMGTYPAITAIAESPLDSNRLYAGTQDGKVWTSGSQGVEWVDITPGLPDRFVTALACSPVDQYRVFVSHSGYRDADNVPYIHVSDDGGMSWYDFSGDLPELAVNSILVYPGRGDSVVFVGTDGGIYGTVDFGHTWERVGTNMPYIPVYDIKYHPVKNEIIAGTHARSIQTFDLDSVDLSFEEPTYAGPEREKEQSIQVYPTIVDDFVLIRFPDDGPFPYTLTVFDMQGRLLLRRSEITLPEYRLDLKLKITGGIVLVTENAIRSHAVQLIKI